MSGRDADTAANTGTVFTDATAAAGAGAIAVSAKALAVPRPSAAAASLRTGAAIVFDFGAVVFHWQPLDVLRATLPALAAGEGGAERLAAQIFQGFGPTSDWALFDLGRTDEEGLAERIAARTGLAADDVRAVIRAVPPALIADPATVALMRCLKVAGQRVYFLSNMPAPYVAYLRRHNDFFDLFDGGVFSCDVGLMKPGRALFDHAARTFGLAADGMLPVFVDDSAPNVEAARALGWDAFVYRNAAQCRRELADRGLL